MAVEIERRFLVRYIPDCADGNPIVQGYLALDHGVAVRVRRTADAAWLTIKGPRSYATAHEYEWPIALDDARGLFALCGERVVYKTRYTLDVGVHTFEIDVFERENAGLVIAEIELSAQDEFFERPPWLGAEITGDARYNNAALAQRPFASWASSS